MTSDDLTQVLDDAYPTCPQCLVQLEDVPGDPYRPHLICPSCTLVLLVPGQ